VELKDGGLKYVGRGGLKMEGAMNAFSLDVRGKTCVDIGASTGGFTDCLLQNGARKVYAVDCGSGQLHPTLLKDERVVNIENFNARNLDEAALGERCDLAVMDVSFISQTLLHKATSDVLNENGIFISLIKPQFEVGRENIGKGGIVKDKKAHKTAIENVIKSARTHGLALVKIAVSPIKGGDGNKEYLALFKKSSEGALTLTKEKIDALLNEK
jgi:23S rRNA (cytidine1920-2'-O)/16S rRNA (cytidine1409-2'-O)-methyltransferase